MPTIIVLPLAYLGILYGRRLFGERLPDPEHDGKREDTVRYRAAGLLTSIEYPRKRDSTWNVPHPIIATRIGVELVK